MTPACAYGALAIAIVCEVIGTPAMVGIAMIVGGVVVVNTLSQSGGH